MTDQPTIGSVDDACIDGATSSSGSSLAESYRDRFAAQRGEMMRSALCALERLYQRQQREFLRTPEMEYADWLKHGPREELHRTRAHARLLTPRECLTE